MNKTILILAIFAFCLAPPAFSSELKENDNRELAGIKLGNLGDIIKDIVGAIKDKTNNTTTNSTNPTNPNTPPATNYTRPTNPTTPPASNYTNNETTPTSPPATNYTRPINPTTPPASNYTNNETTPTSPPATNYTRPTNPTTPPASNFTNNETTTITPPETNNNTYPSVPNNTNNTDSNPSTNSTNNTTPTTPTAPVKLAKNDVNMTTFQSDCMKVHNQVRMDVGLNNLTWSDSLAKSAQAWAENMAVNGFRHSGKTGENIASSTYSTKTLKRLLGLWTKEKNWFIVGCKYPKCSNSTAEVGHYTQMVWHSTTQVGCGFAPGVNRSYNYLCCQYYKAGNIVGQYVY